ncbi:MAG: ribbon-helix-helix protein, CopG family [Micrococcales bacterium]|nr:ribbon-helix-helix protein, CopG family [Micrococcales bacterium]
MSLMERRLQLLLDSDRYGRIAAEAERSGRSVAAVIREAIDFRFPGLDDRVRVEAAQELLALTATPAEAAGEGPRELKEAFEAQFDDIAGRR